MKFDLLHWKTGLPGKPVDPWRELVLVPPLLDPEPSPEFRTKKRFANFVREAELSNLRDFPTECNNATENSENFKSNKTG